MSSKPAIVMTEAEAALVVEAARLFVDPRTGEVPTVAVKAWDAELEAWWQFRPKERASTDLLGCSVCGNHGLDRLYANVDGRDYCASCWTAVGRPWPKRQAVR